LLGQKDQTNFSEFDKKVRSIEIGRTVTDNLGNNREIKFFDENGK
jgi:hypothetical protein